MPLDSNERKALLSNPMKEGVLSSLTLRPRPDVSATQDQTRVLSHLLSGQATFDALTSAVQELSRLAPDDCDVLVQVGDIFVLKASFVEPHTFSFEGLNKDGHRTWVVIHFSQLAAS